MMTVSLIAIWALVDVGVGAAEPALPQLQVR